MSYDQTPTTSTQESLKQTEKLIDERVREAADLLGYIDQAVSNIAIDSSGKFVRDNVPNQLSQIPNTVFSEPYKELKAKYLPSAKIEAEKMKSEGSGFIDVALAGGTIIISFDSSKAPLKMGRINGDKNSGRGEHFLARNGHLGIVLVDISKDKRSDGTTPQTTLTHELHHNNLSLVDYLVGQDPKVKMLTAVRVTTDSDLFGQGFDNLPKTGFISKQSFELDKEKYSALMEREYKPGDNEVLQLQLLYLDELHSSYLQKKQDWFLADRNVYSGIANGKHWEIVGKYPEDQVSAKKILAVTQSIYLVDYYVMPTLKVKAAEPGAPEYAKQFAAEWPNFFIKIGALIGTARTVKQCERLIEGEWQKFKVKYQELFTKNEQAFKALAAQWKTQGFASEYLDQELL